MSSATETPISEMAPPAKLMLRVDDAPFIVKEVLRQVGRPESMIRIDAKRTWGNHYRVNLYCSKDTGTSVRTVSITDSFFVTMTENGMVSEPPITRKYESCSAK